MLVPLIYLHQERKGNLGSRSGRWAGFGEEDKLYSGVGLGWGVRVEGPGDSSLSPV